MKSGGASRSVLLWVLFAGAAVFAISCSSDGKTEKPAITIDAYRLTASEFGELYREYGSGEPTPQSKEAFLENLITRKLLLQEAQRRGLDTRKPFLKTVEKFWEQSLLRSVVDDKMKEMESSLTVSNKEIEDQYQEWVRNNPEQKKPFKEVRDMIEWRVRKEKEARLIGEWTKSLGRSARVKVDRKSIGLQ